MILRSRNFVVIAVAWALPVFSWAEIKQISKVDDLAAMKRPQLSVPLNDGGTWQTLSYKNVKPNIVKFSESGLKIKVNESSGPIIFPLKKTLEVAKVRVEGQFSSGALVLGKGTQGEEGFDDFRLRVGLVIEGNQRLNFFQRKIAAEWILKLFSLAGEKSGVDHILFLNVTEQKALVGRQRTHPLSDLIKEEFVWQKSDLGKFSLEKKLSAPQKVLALWIAVDGDDTKSQFSTEISKLEIY